MVLEQGKLGSAGIYNKSLNDHSNEPKLTGVYRKSLTKLVQIGEKLSQIESTVDDLLSFTV